MALAGEDTAALGTYSDANANDQRFIAIRDRIKVDTKPDPKRHRHAASVSIELKDGRMLKVDHNVGIPANDVSQQSEKLEAKFHALAEPVIGRARTKTALGLINRFEELPNLKTLMEAVG